jgi:lipopolysaccharide export system protein LptC
MIYCELGLYSRIMRVVFNSSFFSEKNQLSSGHDKFKSRSSSLKKLFSFLALLFAVLLFVLPALDPSSTDDFRLTFDNINYQGASREPIMVNPKFQGVDDSGYPYSVTASEARNVQSDNAKLIEVQADIQTAPNEWVYFFADSANYHKIKNKLDLFGNVHIFSSNGYELKTPALSLDIKHNSLVGNQAIAGQGPLGFIRANRLEVQDKGDYVKFEGKVKLNLFLATKG